MSRQSSDTWGQAGHLGQTGNPGLPLPHLHSGAQRPFCSSLMAPLVRWWLLPNLKAIELPRPQEAVPGWHCPYHHMQLQCTCISGWPGLNSPWEEEGRGRMRLGIHTMLKRWLPTRVATRKQSPCSLLCIHCPLPNSFQLPEQKL